MTIRWREHEFILVTMLSLMLIAGLYWIFFVLGVGVPEAQAFEEHRLGFNVYRNALLPDTGIVLLLYGAYLAFSRDILPRLLANGGAVGRAGVSSFIQRILLLVLLTGTGLYTAMYYKHEWAGFYFPDLAEAYLVALVGTVVFLVYVGVRESLIAAIGRAGGRKNYWTLVCNQFTAFACVYIAIPFLVAIFRLVHDGEPIAIYFSFTLPIFLVYMVNVYWLFPMTAVGRFLRVSAILRLLGVTFVCALPFLLAPFHEGVEPGFFGCWLVLLFVATPLTWILFQWRKDKILQLRGVETALAKSAGDLQFLRSQINPHFLFNSLNTLYGFAIREEAGLTAGGIQQLGDMMRFMLEENTKDRILLEQEVDYLKNYIALQRMRIDTGSDVRVDVRLDQACREQSIAPMLLIPFVENAFKHGISLDYPSWIGIDLQCFDNRVVFEVRNSLHPELAGDPEKGKGGIGNKNVTDRLNLIYAGKHTLRFSQSEAEYVVRLTILLN